MYTKPPTIKALEKSLGTVGNHYYWRLVSSYLAPSGDEKALLIINQLKLLPDFLQGFTRFVSMHLLGCRGSDLGRSSLYTWWNLYSWRAHPDTMNVLRSLRCSHPGRRFLREYRPHVINLYCDYEGTVNNKAVNRGESSSLNRWLCGAL